MTLKHSFLFFYFVCPKWGPWGFKTRIGPPYTQSRRKRRLKLRDFSEKPLLKLVRNPLNVYFAAFKSIFLFLYAPFTSYECHAWFHFNAASPAARTTEQVNITKILVHGRIRTTNMASLDFLRVTLTHSAIGVVDDIWLKLLQYLFTFRYCKNSVVCKGIYRKWK